MSRVMVQRSRQDGPADLDTSVHVFSRYTQKDTMLLSRMLAAFHIWGLLVVIRQWDVAVSMAMPPGRDCFPTCFYQ